MSVAEPSSIAKQRLERILVGISTALEEGLSTAVHVPGSPPPRLLIDWKSREGVWLVEGVSPIPIDLVLKRAIANLGEIEKKSVVAATAEVLEDALRSGAIPLPNFERAPESTQDRTVLSLVPAEQPVTVEDAGDPNRADLTKVDWEELAVWDSAPELADLYDEALCNRWTQSPETVVSEPHETDLFSQSHNVIQPPPQAVRGKGAAVRVAGAPYQKPADVAFPGVAALRDLRDSVAIAMEESFEAMEVETRLPRRSLLQTCVPIASSRMQRFLVEGNLVGAAKNANALVWMTSQFGRDITQEMEDQ